MSKVSDQSWVTNMNNWLKQPGQNTQANIDALRGQAKAIGIDPGEIGGSDNKPASASDGDFGPDDHDTPEAPPAGDTTGGGQPPAVDAAKPSEKSKVTSGDNTGQGTRLGSGIPPQAEQYRQDIENASEKSGVPASLLGGMIHDESRWNDKASTVNGGNGGGDTGLMQMNDTTFKDLQSKHPDLAGKDKNDPATNILAGAYYMAEMKQQMSEKFGKDGWDIALRAYNSGPNGVDPNNLNSLPAGTGDPAYVDKIMGYWKTIDNGGQLPP